LRIKTVFHGKEKKNFWGISPEIVEELSEQLLYYFSKYRHLLRPFQRDTSCYALQMLKGYLLLESDRTYANIDRKINGEGHKDGQNLQQYMSDSPWESAAVFKQIQNDIGSMPFLAGGTMNFDESGDECSGRKKAGASRQYVGRLGKVELGQVVVLGSFYKDGYWLLTDAALFLPEEWFGIERKEEWNRLHIPPEQTFKTKVELAKEFFLRAVSQGLPFEMVGFDSLYGRDMSFRRLIVEHGKHYMACIPSDTQFWLADPNQSPDTECVTAKNVVQRLVFETLESRHAERGALRHEHAFLRVWCKQNVPKSNDAPLGYVFHPETLVVRKEHDGSTSFALSDVDIQQKQQLVTARADRYFVERTIQDCKSELGFDELQALKYPAVMHTLALNALALLFMADVKHQARQKHSPLEEVRNVFPDVQKIPDLSLSNVKELLRVAFPLPNLSKKQAAQLVLEHLLRRTSATQSRQKKKKYMK
jgi:SRSO17 transposase